VSGPAPELQWQLASFAELDADALYDVLKLRADVFVVEQRCAYADPDGKDRVDGALHLLGRDADGALACYLRILPPGVSYPEVSFGRVVTAAAARGRGLGDVIVERALGHIAEHWPGADVRIGAQSYLLAFYRKHGFASASDEYLEDGIPHRDMLRKAPVTPV
jgi:ElaA protein